MLNTQDDDCWGEMKTSSQGEYNKPFQKWDRQSDNQVNKKGRIVVRNLSFKANKEELQKFFGKYGEVKEVNILKLPNGRIKGAAFVQFNSLLSAMKAIKDCNMKPFMGRPIAVDLAVPKYKYKEAEALGKVKIKEEPVDETSVHDSLSNPRDDTNIKAENTSSSIASSSEVKDNNKEKEKEECEEGVQSEDGDSDIECDEDENSFSDSGMESGDDDVNVKREDSDEDEHHLPKSSFVHKSISKDVAEERTLFLRNFSFDSKEEEIKETLSQFGELKYVLICRDKITKRFKGSAFAQFMTKESADSCLEAYDDPACKNLFKMDGRTIFVTRAVGREQIQNKADVTKKEKEEKPDTRNLYLSREGVIREGTKAAVGVSKRDLTLRTERELLKRKMLANFQIFVSKTRLFISNLPLTLTDKELRNIFRKNSDKDAVITEARIMRNLHELDKDGIAVSRGYGFISFTKHQHALEALRNVNNNPNIFSIKQRPIVEFSMENKGVLKARANRLQKSKEKLRTKAITNNKNEQLTIKAETSKQTPKEKVPENTYMGSKYDPKRKGVKSLHSHVGPKIRHKSRPLQVGQKGTKIKRNKVNSQFRKKNKRDFGKGKTKGVGKKREKGMNKRKEKGAGKRDKGKGMKSRSKARFQKKTKT